MSLFNGDASEIYALAGDLAQVGAKAVGPMREVMGAAGDAFVEAWKSNARETSGVHGKWYPDAIGQRPLLGISTIGVEVGPDVNGHQRQGAMSFEYGSRNQPPHLDGLRALDLVAPRVERMFDAAVGVLFP